MPSVDLRKHWPALAAFALPVIIVKLATMQATQNSPQQSTIAAAAAAPPAMAASVNSSKKWTPKQIEASAFAEALREQPFGPTPFLIETLSGESPSEVDITPDPIIEDPTHVQPIPKFTVGAVMSGASGRRTLINGRPYREGETVKGTTWTVFAIDCDKRSVTLRDRDQQREVTVTVELPQ